MKPSSRIAELRREFIEESRRALNHEPNPDLLQWTVMAIVKYLDEEYDRTVRQKH
jgi:hypothetical protein